MDGRERGTLNFISNFFVLLNTHPPRFICRHPKLHVHSFGGPHFLTALKLSLVSLLSYSYECDDDMIAPDRNACMWNVGKNSQENLLQATQEI